MEKARRSASRTGDRLGRIASSIFPWRRRGKSIWWGRGSRRCGWKSSATWIPPRDFSPCRWERSGIAVMPSGCATVSTLPIRRFSFSSMTHRMELSTAYAWVKSPAKIRPGSSATNCVCARVLHRSSRVWILICPRKHFESLTDASQEDQVVLGKLQLVAAQLARERQLLQGYRTVLNSGEGAGQSVFHLHLHLLGGRPFRWQAL